MSWKDDLNYGLAAFGLKIPDRVEIDDYATKLTGVPARNTAAVVAASTIAFYVAEKNHNPKVNDIWDALVYCTTCLSVGYGDIFARTPAGKIIGSALMTAGPALSGAALDGKRLDSTETQEEILKVLQVILARLPQPDGEDVGHLT